MIGPIGLSNGGAITGLGNVVTDMAIDSSGRLLAVTDAPNSTSRVIQIDQSTGAGTEINSFNLQLMGMAFLPTTNQLVVSNFLAVISRNLTPPPVP
jgi:hypothetical protein